MCALADTCAQIPAGVAAWHMDPKLYVTKPMGFSSFQYEIASAPKHWAELSGNLQYYNFHERVRA